MSRPNGTMVTVVSAPSKIVFQLFISVDNCVFLDFFFIIYTDRMYRKIS
jgi:hypothetical protein